MRCMKKIVLHIDSEYEHHEITLKDEITFGRTDLAELVLPDSGLSRLNTTIFRDGDEVFIVDENSTNGTFVNGKQVSEIPYKLQDRDEISIGSFTRIRVEILGGKEAPQVSEKQKAKPAAKEKTKVAEKPAGGSGVPLIPLVAGISTFIIIIGAVIAILIVNRETNSVSEGNKVVATIQSGVLIPVRIIDPLGGQDRMILMI